MFSLSRGKRAAAWANVCYVWFQMETGRHTYQETSRPRPLPHDDQKDVM